MQEFSTDKYQRIQPQSGDMDLRYVVSVDGITGTAILGFGTAGSAQHYMTLKSGKIYDPNNRFVGSFSPDEKFSIRTVYGSNGSQGIYDYYINDAPKSTSTVAGAGSYYYDRFHVQPQNCSVSMSEFSLSGACSPLVNDAAYIQITGNIVHLQFSGQDPNAVFRIYTGDTSNIYGLQITYPQFPINFSGNTGIITLSGTSGDIITSTGQIPISFQTDCGRQSLLYNITGTRPVNNMLVNMVGNTKDYDPDDSNNYYVVTYNNVATGHYKIRLDYIDGEAEMYTYASGTGVGSGFFSSSEIGPITGLKIYNSSNMTGDAAIVTPGGFSDLCHTVGYGYADIYATGETVYNYDIQVVGMAGSSPATGMLEGSLTGYVNDGSGYFCFHQDVVGTPTISLTYTGVIVPSPGTPYTGHINVCQITTGVRPDGYYTGEFIGACLFYEGSKVFEETWALETGVVNNTGSTAKDYYNEGWFYTGLFGDPGNTGDPKRFDNTGFIGSSTLPAGYNSIYAKVTYTNDYTEGSFDLARLIIETPYAEEVVDDYSIVLRGSKAKTFAEPPTLNSGGLLTEGGEDITTEGGYPIYV